MRAVILAAAAVAFSSACAEAQTRPGQYGGGFIEYLMSGGASGAQPASLRAALRNEPAPQRQAAYGAPMAGYQPQVQTQSAPTRLAALPSNAYEASGGIARAPEPRYARQVVPFEGHQRPGSIVIDTGARHLYLVQPGGQAIRYGIGVGRPGFLWHGVKTISQKREWPDWTPPAEMMLRRPDLPRHMEGGPENPLGARAMYLGSSLYRIHGTNEPHTIGQAVSSGCIRMMNEDVIDLYERTPVGTRVEVI